MRLRSSNLLVLLGLLVAGCGSGTESSSGVTKKAAVSTVPAGRTVRIVMRSLAFNPPAVRAKVGQTVIWTNEDNAPHNVTYVSGPRFRSSRPKLRPGARFSLTLDHPGTIDYYCSIHPWMTATITVSP
ncbi:MAG: cupredoxin domain-containing protein [Solirubrobacteraceae bacterium]